MDSCPPPGSEFLEKLFDEKLKSVHEKIDTLQASMIEVRDEGKLNTAFRDRATGIWIGVAGGTGIVFSVINLVMNKLI